MIAVLVCRMLRVTHEPEQPIAVIIRASDFGYFLLPACTVDREPHQLAHRDFLPTARRRRREVLIEATQLVRRRQSVALPRRSEERRVGKEGVLPCRSRW